MSVDLGTQIRDYAQTVDATQEPFTVDEITERRLGLEPVRPVGSRPYPVGLRPRRRWLAAIAPAVAVLVLVGGAALFLRVVGSDTPVATTPPTDPLSSSSWSRVAHDEAVFGGEGAQSMVSVTAGGPGLVAVGSEGLRSDLDAAVWTSVDGVTWSRVPHDEALFGGSNNQSMSSVTAGGPGLVAVGSDRSVGDGVAVVWTSVDGVTWSRVPHDEAVFGAARRLEMVSVTAGGPGVVAVGQVGSSLVFDDPELDADAAVWTSVDGITWSRVPHDEAVFGGEFRQSMMSVTAGDPGLVAVGLGGDGVAAVWTSVDGITWSRVPHDEAVFGGTNPQSMMSVTAGGPGLVAIGSEVWTSVDGVTWSRVPHDEAVFGGTNPQWMNSVTAGAPGLVAVGGGISGGSWVAAVWTSPDGVTWSRIPHDEAVFGGQEVGFGSESHQSMNSVTAGGPGLVAVGFDSPVEPFGPDGDPAVWTATTED